MGSGLYPRVLWSTLLCFSLLLPASTLIFADQPAESVAILARAHNLESLRASDSHPFALHMRLQGTFDNRPVDGEYRLNWWSEDNWQEYIWLADFRRVREGAPGGYRQLRTWDYEPTTIFQLETMLHPASLLYLASGESARKPYKRKIAGVALQCVEITGKNGAARNLCFDTDTGLLRHAEVFRSSTSPGSLTIEYRGAATLSDKTIPATMKIPGSKDFTIEASVAEFTSTPQKATIANIQNAEFWPTCSDSNPAVLVEHPAPEFPDKPVPHSVLNSGIVSLYLRIEPDGTVSHLKTLQAPTERLERAARQAVARWRYKPASCNGAGIPTETVIDIIWSGF